MKAVVSATGVGSEVIVCWQGGQVKEVKPR